MRLLGILVRILGMLALTFFMGGRAVYEEWFGSVKTPTLVVTGPWLALLAIGGGVALIRASIYLAPMPGDFNCPHCSKTLRKGAQYCRFCHRSLKPSNPLKAGDPFSA